MLATATTASNLFDPLGKNIVSFMPKILSAYFLFGDKSQPLPMVCFKGRGGLGLLGWMRVEGQFSQITRCRNDLTLAAKYALQ